MLMKTCEMIANNYNGVRSVGWGGVGGMFSAGYNVGYKRHISLVALSNKMNKLPRSYFDHITNCLSTAGNCFCDEFGSKDVGFNEMLEMQQAMWPKRRNCPKGPACWIVSDGLGNPQHIDDDYSRSFAGWFTEHEIKNQSAWFLFPGLGVAIELCNDTWISWDGRNCAHCSSVPHLSDENHIYSLFTAITKKVYSTCSCVNTHEKVLCESRINFESLKINDKVSLRWVQSFLGNNTKQNKRRMRKCGNKNHRWLHCTVKYVNYVLGTIELCERNKNQRKLPQLSKRDIHNRLVLGSM